MTDAATQYCTADAASKQRSRQQKQAGHGLRNLLRERLRDADDTDTAVALIEAVLQEDGPEIATLRTAMATTIQHTDDGWWVIVADEDADTTTVDKLVEAEVWHYAVNIAWETLNGNTRVMAAAQ